MERSDLKNSFYYNIVISLLKVIDLADPSDPVFAEAKKLSVRELLFLAMYHTRSKGLYEITDITENVFINDRLEMLKNLQRLKYISFGVNTLSPNFKDLKKPYLLKLAKVLNIKSSKLKKEELVNLLILTKDKINRFTDEVWELTKETSSLFESTL